MAELTVETTAPVAQTENRPQSTREATRYLTPAVDIFETEQELAVLVDMPGVERDGVDVRVEKGILTLQGTVNRTAATEPVWQEFTLGRVTYFRQFELADTVDTERIEASLRNGVLAVRLHKADWSKPRRINVVTE